jgi:hypothetical protein
MGAMESIKEQYNKFVIKSQESFLNLESKKRIELMLQHIYTTPSDVLLDEGGNTGRITEVYARTNCILKNYYHRQYKD